jgi:hypothetical protein
MALPPGMVFNHPSVYRKQTKSALFLLTGQFTVPAQLCPFM